MKRPLPSALLFWMRAAKQHSTVGIKSFSKLGLGPEYSKITICLGSRGGVFAKLYQTEERETETD